MRLLGGMAVGTVLLSVAVVTFAWTSGMEENIPGFAFGVGVALFSVLTIAMISATVLGRYRERKSGVAFAMLAFLVKLPILAVAIWYASRLGGDAITWFALGLGVVYFALAGAALWLERQPAKRPD